ncbi:hypothetical protein CEXT_412781 [Caerostris extrusa]|uniref:Uncharacterized protein n=1 Tax=Caerostris extrusa TaxID=172846 RepID=A0AAV4XRU6_CAEEX|nr:hypothetical protein CEXT_412781 [Caerostris extrusa]
MLWFSLIKHFDLNPKSRTSILHLHLYHTTYQQPPKVHFRNCHSTVRPSRLEIYQALLRIDKVNFDSPSLFGFRRRPTTFGSTRHSTYSF